MPPHIAIIGTGPTGIYTFKHLIETGADVAISLFEKGPEAGVGMPYSPQTADRTMLANIASIEIPPVVMSYLDFLRATPDEVLSAYEVDPSQLDERAFTPRLLLGRYFRHQFLELVETGIAAGRAIHIHEGTQIADVRREGARFMLESKSGESFGPFDRVVLATGHEFEPDDNLADLYFPNPWSGLISVDIPACRVGIMGTSLSSIDAAMAVVVQHGRFERESGGLRYVRRSEGELSIVLMSRHGILPEADFYCPIPYEPLRYVSKERLMACARSQAPLDAAFELFKQELSADDPAYAQAIGLDALTADSFADAYFAQRVSVDPFRWARENLAEVERNKANRVTVAWRYALLRMHEQFDALLHELSEADRERFDAGLKRVFIDNYAAVPSESIRRLLALRDAGILSVQALGEDYQLFPGGERTRIVTKSGELEFDVFIDARGQKALETAHLPFPSLRQELLAAGQEVPQVAKDYAITGLRVQNDQLYLAAIPYLMHDHPFAQGIVVSSQIGEEVGKACASACREDEPVTQRRQLWA